MSVDETLIQESTERLRKMVELLGFESTITAEDKDGTLSLSLDTDDAGRLIGRKGHCLQSLELLLHRMLRKHHEECPPLEVVIDGYRTTRGQRSRKPRAANVDEERLVKQAEDTAKEVKRWGESRTIGPFNAAERRVIHMTLKEEPGIETESEEADEDGRKSIIVRLA